MKNIDNILSKILVNMNYNSKLTLSENKKQIILEACAPIDLKLDNTEVVDGDTKGINGKRRSEKYTNLGNWGDGKCRCKTKGKKCLEFSKSCCGASSNSAQGQIEVGNVEKIQTDYYTLGNIERQWVPYTSPNGSPLLLPPSAEVTFCTPYEDISSMTPQQFAEFWGNETVTGKNQIADWCFRIVSTYPDVNYCYQRFLDAYLTKTPKEKTVCKFKVDGMVYKNCYYKSIGEKPVTPDTVIWSCCYAVDCSSGTHFWENEKVTGKKKNVDNSSVVNTYQDVDILKTDSNVENSEFGEGGITIQLGL